MAKQFSCGLSSLCVLCVLVVPPLFADWPLFRGNALQTGVATSTLPDRLNVLWTFAAKKGIEPTAAIAGGVVYVGSDDKNLYALDLATGKEQWHFTAGACVAAPASVAEGLVYVGDIDGIFYCLDAATGKQRWQFDTGGEISGGANFGGGVILIGSGDGTLYGLSREGKKLWDFKIEGGPVKASPAVVDGRTFVAGCDSAMHILEVATGKELGSVDLGGQVGATAAVHGQDVYVGTMTNQVVGVDWKKAAALWTFEPKKSNRFFASPAVTDKLLLVASKDRRVYALDRKDGKEVWSYPTGAEVDSSPVVVGPRVFFGTQDGFLCVLGRDKGEEIEKIELDGAVSASPAVAGNRLVISTAKGTVYCFGDGPARKNLPAPKKETPKEREVKAPPAADQSWLWVVAPGAVAMVAALGAWVVGRNR
jgi:outer membrane protein assembly factor BamB